jgi:hypothetical protein
VGVEESHGEDKPLVTHGTPGRWVW